jgi:hypothetical protein
VQDQSGSAAAMMDLTLMECPPASKFQDYVV